MFQLFNVTVTVVPTIVPIIVTNPLPLGANIQLKCNATGNPKPNITWYQNGEPVKYDYLVNNANSTLRINTYEQNHKGKSKQWTNILLQKLI